MTAKAHLSVVPPNGGCRALNKDLRTEVGRIAHYRQTLLEAGLAVRTVDLYCAEIHRLEWWCEEKGYSLRNVPAVTLGEYVKLRPKTFATQNLIRTAVRRYWEVFKRKNPPLWVFRVPRKPKMVCRALDDDEAQKLVAAAKARGGKEGLAVLLALYEAFRREEIAVMRWDDLTGREGWIRVVGKGEQEASLPLHPVVAEALSQLEHRDSVWVFPGQRRGDHVNPSTVWLWVKKLAEDAGLSNVTPHRLRHSSLAKSNDVTGDLRAVQDFARHSRVDTTAGYTQTLSRRLEAAVNAVNYEVDEVDPTAELAGLLGQRPGWRFEPADGGTFRVWREVAP